MAGLLAWAADVVGAGGGGQENDGIDDDIPIIYSPEQQRYALELDHKASILSRSIQDLRLRLPPPDISDRLPHLHAHSVASSAALALQLNAHSGTRHQAQLREVALKEENENYEKAISSCETKIQDKIHEAHLLITKLQEIEESEKSLRAELENAQTALEASRSVNETEKASEVGLATESLKSTILDQLESKKKELGLVEERVQVLERQWSQLQDNALKQPSPAQREKTLDRQLHSLIEQLAAKQAQAEGLVGEIHIKELELERVNGLWRRLDGNNFEANTARNRFGRSMSDHELPVSDYDPYHKGPYSTTASRNEGQQRTMFLRSSFVLYILVLHILVFIKISF